MNQSTTSSATAAAAPAPVAPQRAVPEFLVALERAVTPPEKEKLLFRFAATLDTIFYDLPAAPATREGNQTERDIQALLEAVFSVLQIDVPAEHTVEPPSRFAALRALGAFVQGTTPVPTVLSEDWKKPHVPLYLAALRLLHQLFERASTQYVYAIRCLSILAIQSLQVISPLDPVDCAVSSILSSPARNRQLGNNSNASPSPSSAVMMSSPSAGGGGAQLNESTMTAQSSSNATATLQQDSIMQAPVVVASCSVSASRNRHAPPTGTPLRITPAAHHSQSHNNSHHMSPDGDPILSAGSDSVHAPFLNFESLFMDHLLEDPILRPLVIELWRLWDEAGIDVRVFTAQPEAIHVFLPTRLLSSVSCVYRDFITCPVRQKMEKPWSGMCEIHIKTNIPVHSEVMFRILIEGYNYGVNCPIQSEVVGCAKRSWDAPGGGDPEQLSRMCKDYAEGCTTTQYYSSDRYLVIKLCSKSFFGVGFTASAWMVFHGHSPGFPITGEVFHQEEDL